MKVKQLLKNILISIEDIKNLKKLTSDNEQWLIQNLKILNCEINDTDKSINLELMFDSVSYKNYKKEDKID